MKKCLLVALLLSVVFTAPNVRAAQTPAILDQLDGAVVLDDATLSGLSGTGPLQTFIEFMSFMEHYPDDIRQAAMFFLWQKFMNWVADQSPQTALVLFTLQGQGVIPEFELPPPAAGAFGFNEFLLQIFQLIPSQDG